MYTYILLIQYRMAAFTDVYKHCLLDLKPLDIIGKTDKQKCSQIYT